MAGSRRRRRAWPCSQNGLERGVLAKSIGWPRWARRFLIAAGFDTVAGKFTLDAQKESEHLLGSGLELLRL